MQDKITYTHGTVVNIHIVYKLTPNLNNFDCALENYLFGAVKLTKNADMVRIKIQDMAVDLIQDELFHFLVVYKVKM